ncbi:MAG TPA: hypothetical protein PLR41_08045 [Alphaproteobacteria bacterium]|nr:hypothetical protein [Alphaproteobacteria bacterium]
MILFHVPRIDSGDLRLWRRVLLPAHLMRRAGMPVRIVSGAINAADLTGVATIIFAGAATPETAGLCRLARDAGPQVVLDVGDTRSLTAELPSLRPAAAFAHRLIAANAALALLVAERLGLAPAAVAVLPDLPLRRGSLRASLMAFPSTGVRVFGDALRVRAIDLARCVRRRLLDRHRPPASQASKRGPRVLWFGDGAGLGDEGGLGELLLAAGALVDLAPEVPFRLRVVGSSRRLFRRTVGRLPLDADFRRFTLTTLAREIEAADLCLLPAGGDRVGQAQADARAAFAAALGRPVIGPGPEGAPMEERLRTALRPASAKAAAPAPAAARPDAARAALDAWRIILGQRGGGMASHAAPAAGHRLRVMFLLQQFQDLDLICPVAEAASRCPDIEVRVAVLTKVAVPASRRLDLLRARGARIEFLRARDVADGRGGWRADAVDVAVTASDGEGVGARHAVAFVRAANAAGAVTLNLQHGLDNAGLTYGEPHRQKKEQFASRLVLTWGGFERLTRSANADTRAKVVPVGCPKRRLQRTDVAGFPCRGRTIIAVFENLHWNRYDDAYRQRFIADLVATAKAAPDLLFLLKPHMGGRWTAGAAMARPLPANLVVADPDAPEWRRFTADAFLAHAAAVITTPSTIALDGARYDLPTALVTYGIEADNYAPLPRIEDAADWSGFVQRVRGGAFDMRPVRAFLGSAAVPGDAVARSLEVIRLAAAGRSPAEIVARLGSTPASE